MIITRSEAAFRLKCAIAKINGAVTAVNDGRWPEATEDAREARELLRALIPHLEEAATDPAPATRGGLGYRGSHHKVENPLDPLKAPYPTTSYPTSRPTMARKSDVETPKYTPPPVPPPVLRKNIVTPPPEPRVIVTPPPEPPSPQYEPAQVSIFPIEYNDVPTTTFDFSRMLNPNDRDPEIIRLQALFETLTEGVREALITQYRKTGKPVVCKIRTAG